MTTIPANPKIYHLTHVDNLQQILRAGALWSDSKRISHGHETTLVGIQGIKQRRLKLPVTCHPGTTVGEYVPFYFCPRSIMLYILHMGNHPDLTYREGQRHIVHMQGDLAATVQWANDNGVKWAFTDRNAGTRYAVFYADLIHLDRINWDAVQAVGFRSDLGKEGKQAEFLVHEAFPWELIEKIGVIDSAMADKIGQMAGNEGHRPVVAVERTWYF